MPLVSGPVKRRPPLKLGAALTFHRKLDHRAEVRPALSARRCLQQRSARRRRQGVARIIEARLNVS